MKTLEIEHNVGAEITQIIGDTSKGVSKESAIEQMREAITTVDKMDIEGSEKTLVESNLYTEKDTLEDSKRKQPGESKSKTEDRLKESVVESMELMETMKKTSELGEKVVDHIPRNLASVSQEEFNKSRIQQKDETQSIEEKMDGRESERRPVEVNKDSQNSIFVESIQKDIKKPKIEFKPPKATIEKGKVLSVSRTQESGDVKEAMIKRKGKEIEDFVDKGEAQESRGMHMEANKDLTEETMQEIEDVKKTMIKRKGKHIECFVDKGVVKNPKRCKWKQRRT
ncbi:hypothetical protein RJT34_07289 [Clitoria ternatea]|uniref:Uncharacterized protein n=1 Tax=Clitoria ternatea TaxID=43366 RepID=A0AAN9K4Y1_CLITE